MPITFLTKLLRYDCPPLTLQQDSLVSSSIPGVLLLRDRITIIFKRHNFA